MFFKKQTSSESPKDQISGDGKVVSILNQKGGVGKTTMAFNVAHALASSGHKVLCIDMDPQANLSLLFGIERPDHHIFHLLINSIRELKALHRPMLFDEVCQTVGDIDILPSGQDLSGFELTVAGINAPRPTLLKRFIQKQGLKNRYDYIIIDGPPTLGLIVVNILCASDGVLVPFLPDQFSKKGLSHFHEVLEDIEDMGLEETPRILGYIPNLVEGRRKQEEADFDDIRQNIEQEIIFDPIHNRVQLVKSGAKKKSVFDFSSKEFAPLQEQFLKVARHIEQELN